MSDQDIEVSSVLSPAIGNPERWIPTVREVMRGLVALALLLLLAGEVFYGLYQIQSIAGTSLAKDEKVADARIIMDLLNVVIPPTVALFGAATGFYYGTRAGRS